MSTEQDRARSLAERIASRLAQEPERGASQPAGATPGVNGELAALRESLREMQRRLAQIESHLTQDEPRGQESRRDAARHELPVLNAREAEGGEGAPRRWLSGTYVPAAHPSQERFGIDDAVTELVDFFEREKTCTVEPGGKPCDQCAMCSTRGF